VELIGVVKKNGLLKNIKWGKWVENKSSKNIRECYSGIFHKCGLKMVKQIIQK
jgi:hypothetical protein